tara:strand:+ start:123 stop:449 length:327 start_codon:yes stop_codon:yes gene_type:complete
MSDEFDGMVEKLAKSYSLRTALVEVCDWDDDAADKLFFEVFEQYINLCEYCSYDPSLITDEFSFRKILKANLRDSITEEQLGATIELIDYEIMINFLKLPENTPKIKK